MKTVILFRHARTKSDYFGKDHDHPLDITGILDAKRIGKYLSENNQLPDLVISSSALRAITTAENAMIKGKWPCPLKLDSSIYRGEPFFLLNLINRQDDELSSICLVGHEPNISAFISLATARKKIKFSKGSMARIDFYVQRWNDVTMGMGNFCWQINPDDK